VLKEACHDDKDMAAYVKAADAIREAFGWAVTR
jgi:hypothetical protein